MILRTNFKYFAGIKLPLSLMRKTTRHSSRDGSGILFCLGVRQDKKDKADSAIGFLK